MESTGKCVQATLFLLLIGLESGVSVLNQSLSAVQYTPAYITCKKFRMILILEKKSVQK